MAYFVDTTDPYVTIAYSRQGKPLHSTRIIKADLNPVFEETAVITIEANAIRIGEKISLQLWDSDRSSAVSQNILMVIKRSNMNLSRQDDMMGFVHIGLLGKQPFGKTLAIPS